MDDSFRQKWYGFPYFHDSADISDRVISINIIFDVWNLTKFNSITNVITCMALLVLIFCCKTDWNTFAVTKSKNLQASWPQGFFLKR